MGTESTLVYLAGIGNSGPDHWQRRWYDQRPGGVWVEHDSWDRPRGDAWVDDLERTLAAVEGRAVLVAHSLGCLAVTEWAARSSGAAVAGAVLVAVPDPSGEAFPADAEGFGPPSCGPLPFPTVVVASEDDPYSRAETAADVADHLGAELVAVGRLGHINGDSGLEDWPEGWAILTDRLPHTISGI